MNSNGLLKRDDDFLLMEVQVPTATNVDNLMDDEDDDGEPLAWGLLDRADNAGLWTGSVVPVMITPEISSSMTVHQNAALQQLPPLPAEEFLDEEYRKTKIRFIESMLRTKQTRAIIQYQKRMLFRTSIGHLPPAFVGDLGEGLCESQITFDTHTTPADGTTNDLIREGLLAMLGSHCTNI
jgi:hypothetical protein